MAGGSRFFGFAGHPALVRRYSPITTTRRIGSRQFNCQQGLSSDHDQFDTMDARGPQDVSDPFWNPNIISQGPNPQFYQFHPPLYPLIYSAGPDRIFDIFVNTAGDFHYSTTDPPNDPYTTKPGGVVRRANRSRQRFHASESNHFARRRRRQLDRQHYEPRHVGNAVSGMQ